LESTSAQRLKMKISGLGFATYGAFVHNFVAGLALVVISFVIILKAVIPFAKKHAKQKHTAKLVGETKGQWLLGDVIKVRYKLPFVYLLWKLTLCIKQLYFLLLVPFPHVSFK